MLEDPNSCSLCGSVVTGWSGGFPVYFCGKCFEAHRPAIMAHVPWVKFLMGLEKARRKRRNKLIKSVGLPQFTNTLHGVVL